MNEGASFGQYRVVRKLGQGGMGAVYLGEHTLIGRRAAIKVLHRERVAQRENLERFFTEARATSAMEDPGIVQVYDFGVTPEGVAYLIMEYLDGESLSTRLRRRGALHAADAVRITRQIAGSLAAAHATGIVHRDLKPENLFIIRDGEALGGERTKILDFGIAKLGDDDRAEKFRTRTGVVMGTPAYMSPEQCNDTGRIDHRTDIYSLGCVLFHMLTGRPPFDLHGTGAIISAHLREPAPVLSVVTGGRTPDSLDAIVARCLAKHADERFATMLELQQACDAALAQLPPAPIADPTVLESQTVRDDSITTLGNSAGESSLGTYQPMRRGLWVAIAATAVVAGFLLAVTTRRGHSRSPSPAAAPAPVVEQAPAQPAVPTPQPAPQPPAPAVEPAPVPPATGSGTEVVAAPSPAVPSKVKTLVKRSPPRKPPPPKKRKPPESYEDRF